LKKGLDKFDSGFYITISFPLLRESRSRGKGCQLEGTSCANHFGFWYQRGYAVFILPSFPTSWKSFNYLPAKRTWDI